LKIIAFSSICYDYFPEKNVAVPGGNSLNFAVQINAFEGTEVALAGFIGTDQAAGEILELCLQKGIDTRFLVQLKGNTATNKLYITSEGERFSKPGEWQNGVKDNGIFTEKTWDFILAHDIISLTCNDRHLDELIQRRTKNNFVSVDFMHFDTTDLIGRYLPGIDIAFVSPENRGLRLLKELAFTANKPVVVMLGEEGSVAFYGGSEYRQKAFKVGKVIDTTGCGDAYQAGFCYALNHSATPEEAMYLATETATKVLKGYGGIIQS